MKIKPWMWVVWAVGSLIAFGALEWQALTNDVPDDTLTRTIVEYVPWIAALGVFATAVIAAVWHWWVEYHREDGRLVHSDGPRCSCVVSCQCEGLEEWQPCMCVPDECPCTIQPAP